jgi:hypothetical protein
MKTKTIFIFFLIAISSIIQTACVKEGPRGPAGQNGTNGQNGLDGNANVIASPWITPTAWAGQTSDWYFDVASTAITQEIVENGAILAYVSLKDDLYSGAAVRPLPAYAVGANWDFLIPAYGQIEFTSDALTIPATTGNLFRFILIPSSSTLSLKSGSINGLKKSEFQNMTYKDVCKLLDIAE